MFPSLETKYRRFLELEQQLQDPEVLANTDKLLEVNREYGGLKKVADSVRRFHKLEEEIATAREMLEDEADEETREYAQGELDELQSRFDVLKEELEDLATAGDSITRGGMIMEIRAGTGGDEAAIFAGNLFEMYSRWIEARGWKMEVIDASPSEMGGFKEITFSVTGEGAYHELQFESGGHRVQRVPETESQGRIHTSTATVAVMPEIDDVDITIDERELEITSTFSSGPGGQHMQKNATAARVVHIPTGIMVKVQTERSLTQNKRLAIAIIQARLQEAAEEAQHATVAADRRAQVGTGDRSEKIRTYNYPQNRVTDHRIGYSSYNLVGVMDGDIDQFIDALTVADEAEKLAALT